MDFFLKKAFIDFLPTLPLMKVKNKKGVHFFSHYVYLNRVQSSPTLTIISLIISVRTNFCNIFTIRLQLFFISRSCSSESISLLFIKNEFLRYSLINFTAC